MGNEPPRDAERSAKRLNSEADVGGMDGMLYELNDWLGEF